MITEATRNARSSADRFAADSGSQVGSIRSASQGVFSISAADSVAAGGDESGGGDSGDASIMKKVRVVATVDYYGSISARLGRISLLVVLRGW
jgi:uncharacterized protein